MKILRITLSNIASIAGTHTVDFTQEPLRSAGLFAISGPTGAGKSTLLDALCLALYDQTPRLNKLGRVKDIGNESQTASESLLRRGTARGFVEVAFVGIDNSPYTARWDVRRARESVDGTLKDASIVLYKGHIAPDTKGEIEAGGKKTAVLDAIKGKIGLSFEQFTRAVLLAQNDFAAFLKAKDTDRAEILQKLTGTQEYEEISKRVYQRCQEFQTRIKAKNDLIQANPPFTDDERTAAEERYKTAKSLVATLEEKVSALRKHREWYDHLAELNEKCREAEFEWVHRLQQREQSLQRRKEFQLTEIVKHEATRLREDQKAAEKERNDANEKLVWSSAEVDRIKKEVLKASENYEEAKAALDNWQQQESRIRAEIKKARVIDQQIAVCMEKRHSADEKFQNAENAYNIKNGELDKKTGERKNLKTDSIQIEVELRNLMSYESIAKDAALWINRIEDLISLEVKISEAIDVLSQQQGQVQEAQEKVEKQRKRFFEADKRYKAAQKAYDDADIELKQIDIDRLERDASAVEKSAAILRFLKGQLQARNEKVNQYTDLQKEFEQVQSNRTTEEFRLQELAEKEIPQSEVALKIAQELYDDIARQLEDRTIELRLALVEGKACPVCGSLHHPYSSNAPTEDVLALQAAADKVRQCKEWRNRLNREEDSLRSKRADHERLISEAQDKLKKLDEELSAFVFENADNEIVALILAMPTNEQISETERRCCALEETGKTFALSRTDYRNKSKAIGDLRNAETLRNTEVAKEKMALDTLESEVRKSDQECQATERDLDTYNKKRVQVIDGLSLVWAALPQAKHDALVSGALFLEKFKIEIESFSTLLNRKNELAVRIAQLDPLIRSLSDDLERLLGEKKAREKEFADAVTELEDRKAERNGLLGNRDIEDVEREFDQQRDLFKDRRNAAENTLKQARNNQSMAEDNLSNTAEKAECANDKFSEANILFEDWLRQFNEAHLIDCKVEQIDERIKRDLTWLNRERKDLEDLDRSEGGAKTEHERCKQNLEIHREKRPTDQHYEVAREEFERQEKQRTEAIEEVTEALKPITLDDDRRSRNEAAMKELQVLEERAKPWQELNEIIGSADGSKFRTIAQQVSLDVLLQYTNQQLQQLAPRYRLKRLPSSLNLVVNDCDMGDEIRSIYSLSGGETFLVSLALALGLASLTSNRVRIESLFIDEGFGSLDPETLNVAMGALMQLESQGRKVGVISHVPEMADAIPVQIKVKKGRNGASRIEIPGVTPI